MQENKVVLVPTPIEKEVMKLVNAFNNKHKKTKPIKRKLRISKKEFTEGAAIVKQEAKLGVLREKWCDKLDREYTRLDDLFDLVNKKDKFWIEKQLRILDVAIDYAYHA